MFAAAAPLHAAADGLRLSADLGAALVDFEYEETDDSDRLLDKETGTFPELNLSLGLGAGDWFLSGELRYLRDTAAYTGFPASLPPLKSTTEEEVADVSLRLGLQKEMSDGLTLAVYGGLGLRHWARDIRSTAGASGLDETYEWGYWILGIAPVIRLGPRDRLGAGLQLRRAFDADLDVRFKDIDYDPARIVLDDGIGLRLTLDWMHRIDENYELTLGPYVDLWEFDRSADVELKRDDMVIGSLHEPASQTRIYGIRFFLTRRF